MTRADLYQYDSTRPLVCAESNGRYCRIGVMVGHTFIAQATGERLADVEVGTIWVSTKGFGGVQRELEAIACIKEYTKSIIADLDAVIAELQSHRTRLTAELTDRQYPEEN